MPRLRFILALGMAVTAVGAFVLPAAAETILIECDGTCGYYEVKDMGPTGPKGAVCVYEKPGYDLDEITVRPPLMHGYYDTKTKVAWRFKIRRSNTSGGAYSTIYTSSWQYAMASNTNPVSAGDGFSRRAWMAGENPNGFFDVWTELRWDHNGSREGFARIEYDWYKALRGSSSYTNNEYCLEEY